MQVINSLTVAIVLIGQSVLAAPSVNPAEESGAIASAQASAADAQTSNSTSTAAMQQALDQMRQMLREQDETLRLMRQQIQQQGKEIESLREQRSGAPSLAAAPSNGDPAASATQLQGAVMALRGTMPATAAAPAVAPQVAPTEPTHTQDESSELFFRIGNATVTPSGWVDFTALYRTTDVGSGLGTMFQSISYNNTVQGGLSETRLTAQSSRIGFRVDENVASVHAYGYLEADFNGYLPGNAYVSTNSNTLRMRVYYLNLERGKWEVLGGQGWSLLTPTRKALSPFLADLFNTFHLDTSYQAGLIYARQTQFRLIYHPSKFVAMGLSVENPEQYSGSAVTFPTLFSNTETDIASSSGSGGGTATPNADPDVIAKTTFDRYVHGLYWHMGAAGLLTSMRVFTPTSVTKGNSVTDTREGGAGLGNIDLELFKGFYLLGQGYWSDGGGRYIGGMGPGFVVLQPGSATSPFNPALIHSGSAIGGFEWVVPKRTTISGYYSGAYFQRRYGFDPDIKTPTYIGYGYPGSANSDNRAIEEASFASITTLWQNSNFGSLQMVTQSSWVNRAPWYVAPAAPRDAHVFMEFMNLRYVIP